jgi:predicted GIY-YIG superfamily endonuclease
VSFGWAGQALRTRSSSVVAIFAIPKNGFTSFQSNIARTSSCTYRSMTNGPWSVYVLRSTVDPSRYYTGATTDVQRRLAVHNSGGSRHTSKLRPWQLVVSLEFSNESSALAFEKYLKSGSGRAFAKRRFV